MKEPVHLRTHAWLYICMKLHVNNSTCAWTYIHVHDHIFAWSYICMIINVHEQTCACTYLCMNVIVHGRTCAWTYLCMNIPVPEWALCENFWVFDLLGMLMMTYLLLLNKIIVVDNISGVGGLTAVANLYFLSPFWALWQEFWPSSNTAPTA